MNKIIGLLLIFGLAACSPNPQQSTTSNSNQEVSNETVSVLEAKSMAITGALDFGNMLPTDSSKLVSFTLKNNGTEALTGPATISGSDFYLSYQNCTTVAVGKSCSVKVSFNPKGKSGPYTSTLTLDSVSGTLTASVTPPEPPAASVQFLVSSVDVSSSGLDFGTITDKQSIIKNISIKNNGQSVILSPSVVLGSNYSVSYNTCSGKDLAKGSSCSVKVSLNGSGKSGAISDSLQFAGKSLALSGQVTATSSSSGSGSSGSSGSVNLAFFNGTNNLNNSYSYGTLSGTQSSILIATIKNTGTLAFSGGPVSLSSTDFSIVYNACNNKSLAIGASCSIRISFTASGKANNTYSGTLSIGSASLSLSGTVQTASAVITYAPQYSSYGTCSAQVCDGSGIKSRTISACRKLSDGVDIGSATLSNCSSFNVPSNLQQACQSPAGNKTIAIDNGSKEVSCDAGSNVQNLVSLTCSSDFHEQSGACVADIISFEPSYSAFGACSAQACDGTGSQSRSLSSCQKIKNGTPVSGGQLSDCSAYNTAGYLDQPCFSPAGDKVSQISNGSSTMTCSEGQTSGSIIVSCIGGYHESSGSCVQDSNNSGGISPVVVVTRVSELALPIGNETQEEVSFNPAPISKTVVNFANQSDIYRYTFPSGTSSVSVTSSGVGTMVFDSFEGDCSGITCSLSITQGDSIKAIMIRYKDTASKFKVADLDKTVYKACILPSGNNMGVGNNPGFMTAEECENPNKQVSYSTYDCGSLSEMDCNSHSGCYYDNMGGGYGYDCSSFDQWSCNSQMGCWYDAQYGDCSMNTDEWSCGSSGYCSWQSYNDPENPSSGYCQGGQYQISGYCQGGYQWGWGGGGGTCQGGMQSQCVDSFGNNMYMPESDCNSAGLTGQVALNKGTAGGMSSSPTQLYPSNGSELFFRRTNSGLNKIDINTMSISNLNSYTGLDSSDAYFNGKYYYISYDYPNYNLRYSDGTVGGTGIVSASGVAQVSISGQASFASGTYVMAKLAVLSDGVYLILNQIYSNTSSQILKVGLDNVLVPVITISGSVNYNSNFGTKDKMFFCKDNIINVLNRSDSVITSLGASCPYDAGSVFSLVDYNSNTVATTTAGHSIFVSNGTVSGTYISSNISPNSYLLPIYVSGSLFFSGGNNPAYGGPELFKISGTPETSFLTTATLAADIVPGSFGSSPRFVGAVNGKVIVRHYNSNYQYQIAAVDSSSNEISTLLNSSNSNDYMPSMRFQYGQSGPGIMLDDGLLYFAFNKKIWKTDGTILGTVEIPGFTGSVYSLMKVGPDKFAFIGTTDYSGIELFIYTP